MDFRRNCIFYQNFDYLFGISDLMATQIDTKLGDGGSGVGGGSGSRGGNSGGGGTEY